MTTERDRRRIPRLSALLVAAAVVISMGQAAMAGPNLAVKVHGACNGPSHWNLVIQPKTSGLVVRFTVAGGAAGQAWHVFISDRGKTAYIGTPTSSSDGSFVVTARVKDLLGLDKIAIAANNTDTGELCGAHATIE